MARPSDLDPFFYPESIAVVGASEDETKPSGIVLKNLLSSFHGKVYPVNPRHSELLGLPCFPSVAEIPGGVSLSVLITPPAIIPGLLGEHAAKGIHHVIIASSGFGETEGGTGLEREIKEVARGSGIRIIGPNCLGIFHPSAGLDTFFLPIDRVPRPGEGNISIISQSGSILGTTMILLQEEGLGVAKAVSYGNRVDVSETELLEYLSVDDETKVIGICLESVSDGREFIRASQRCQKVGQKLYQKPLVAIKLGQEPAGKKAARSHTGSMAGRYEVFQAAFRRSGIYEAGALEEFIDLLKTLSMQGPREGRRVLIVTNAGGVGVMTADLCNREGLDVPDLPSELREKLRPSLPPYYSLSNPVDLTGNSTDDEFALVLSTCLEHFDAAILIPFMTVPGITPALSNAVIKALGGSKRPVVSLCPFVENGEKLRDSFKQYGIPILPTPLRVVRVLAHLLRKRSVEEIPEGLKNYQGVPPLLEEVKGGGMNLLSPQQKDKLLGALCLKYPKSIRSRNQAEAVSAARSIGFPVALKISSPDILHKTDVGGVRLDIGSIKELREAYKGVLNSAKKHIPHARILGMDVEEMVPSGVEVIISGIRDQHFGPVMMFGLGGVFVEVIRDVSFEIAPTTYNGARRMIESLKGYPVLKGVRGKEGVDIDAIARAIVGVSEVITLCPEIEEIELNPVIAYPSGMSVVDVRIILKSNL